MGDVIEVFGPDDPRHPDPHGYLGRNQAWIMRGTPSDTPRNLEITPDPPSHGVDKAGVELEPVSAGGCAYNCGAHHRPCILRTHDGPCYCVGCPWPARRRMVRHAAR